MSRRIHIVINPAAGQREPILNTLNEVLSEAGVEWDVSVTHEYGDAIQKTRQAVERGVDVVAAYGGDGTVMEVANGLMESGLPMAILPGGTGNVFSLELGLPQDLADAARLACDPGAQVRQVDVGQSGQRHFLLRLLLGFGARRVHLATRELRDRYGRMAYLVAAMQALPDAQPIHYQFTLDGEEAECESFTCLIANAGNIGLPGISLVPDVSVSDGLLDVIAIRAIDLKTLSSVVASIADRSPDPDSFHHWQARQITVQADPPQPVVGDGEAWGDSPISAKVLPGAIRIIAPGK